MGIHFKAIQISCSLSILPPRIEHPSMSFAQTKWRPSNFTSSSTFISWHYTVRKNSSLSQHIYLPIYLPICVLQNGLMDSYFTQWVVIRHYPYLFHYSHCWLAGAPSSWFLYLLDINHDCLLSGTTNVPGLICKFPDPAIESAFFFFFFPEGPLVLYSGEWYNRHFYS